MIWRHAKWIVALGLLASGAAAGAELPSAEPVARPPETGDATRQWLDAQRQGKQASAKPQPLSGPVQEQVYERYRKSFARPIPDRFQREQVGGGTSTR